MLTSDVSASSESVAISMIRLLFSTAAFELEAIVVAMRRASASNSAGHRNHGTINGMEAVAERERERGNQ